MSEASQSNRTGRKPSVGVSPDAMRNALNELASLPTIEVKTFGTLFRVGLNTAYAAAREARFGAVQLGGQYRFPSAVVRDALGIRHPDAAMVASQENDP